MSTATLPAPAVPGLADGELTHLYCCDPDVAWCGQDISGMAFSPPSAAEPECRACDLADEMEINAGCRGECVQ